MGSNKPSKLLIVPDLKSMYKLASDMLATTTRLVVVISMTMSSLCPWLPSIEGETSLRRSLLVATRFDVSLGYLSIALTEDVD